MLVRGLWPSAASTRGLSSRLLPVLWCFWYLTARQRGIHSLNCSGLVERLRGVHWPYDKLWTIFLSVISPPPYKNEKESSKSSGVPLQNSARLLVLERVFWSGDAHQQRVILGVFCTVAHQVRRSLGHLQRNQSTRVIYLDMHGVEVERSRHVNDWI